MAESQSVWPALPFSEWKETAKTLHMWTQIVGKIRLALTPWTNHSWHVTLYLTARGLTTSPIPFGLRIFEIRFDFVSHELRVIGSDGGLKVIPLVPQTVAQFYRAVMSALDDLAIEAHFSTTPNEVDPAIPFEENETDAAYDPEYANRFWRVLLQSDRVFKEFRSDFCGKCSPVHFFWGSFDLAVTRFSGRPAPEHPGGVPHLPDTITREAYSHEVSSCGFWPGGEPMPAPVFYSYAYPEPKGFSAARVQPAAAFYTDKLREFILPYEGVRTAASPDEILLQFMQSTYEAAADLAKWDRAALEQTSAPLLSPHGIRK